MAKTTDFLQLKLYDAVEDASIPNKQVVTDIFGYTGSNMQKIDNAIKNIDTNIKEVITNSQIDQLFS